MRSLLKWVLCVLVLWFLIHEAFIIHDGLADDVVQSEYAVVFGTTVNADGTLSPRLKARLDKGLELYRTAMVQKIVVSGGLGKEGHYEGTKMAEYLVGKGVPLQAIWIDDMGNNTGLTAKNFVAKYPNSASVIVVTQYFHITRAKLAFRNVGVHNVTGSHAHHFELRDVYSTFREFFGFYKYWLVG